jgi:hypothetical protein
MMSSMRFEDGPSANSLKSIHSYLLYRYLCKFGAPLTVEESADTRSVTWVVHGSHRDDDAPSPATSSAAPALPSSACACYCIAALLPRLMQQRSLPRRDEETVFVFFFFDDVHVDPAS